MYSTGGARTSRRRSSFPAPSRGTIRTSVAFWSVQTFVHGRLLCKTDGMTVRASGIDPDFRAGGIDPDFRAGGIDPDFRAGNIDPDFRAGGIVPDFRAGGIDPDFRASGIDPDFRASGIDPDFRAGLECMISSKFALDMSLTNLTNSSLT